MRVRSIWGGPFSIRPDAHPNFTEEKEKGTRTVEAVMQLLLSANANLSVQNNEGSTPLHLAANLNALNLVKLMVKASEVRAGAQIETVAISKKRQ